MSDQEIMSRIETIESTLSLVIETIKSNKNNDRAVEDLGYRVSNTYSYYVELSRDTKDRLNKLEQRVGELNTDSDVKRIMIDIDKEVWNSIESNTLAINTIDQRLSMIRDALDRVWGYLAQLSRNK